MLVYKVAQQWQACGRRAHDPGRQRQGMGGYLLATRSSARRGRARLRQAVKLVPANTPGMQRMRLDEALERRRSKHGWLGASWDSSCFWASGLRIMSPYRTAKGNGDSLAVLGFLAGVRPATGDSSAQKSKSLSDLQRRYATSEFLAGVYYADKFHDSLAHLVSCLV